MKAKPKLYKRSGHWVCSTMLMGARGATPNIAYLNWRIGKLKLLQKMVNRLQKINLIPEPF